MIEVLEIIGAVIYCSSFVVSGYYIGKWLDELEQKATRCGKQDH